MCHAEPTTSQTRVHAHTGAHAHACTHRHAHAGTQCRSPNESIMMYAHAHARTRSCAHYCVYATSMHTQAVTGTRTHTDCWMDPLLTSALPPLTGMRQVWRGRPRRDPPPAKECICVPFRPHRSCFARAWLWRKFAPSPGPLLCEDGNGPQPLGVGTVAPAPLR
jgi:hypothetical protein